MRDNEFHQFPTADQITPVSYTLGKPLFPFLSENPEYGTAFNNFMAARRQATWHKWYNVYPAAERLPLQRLKTEKDAVLLVDVGGGTGYWTQAFSEHFQGSLPGRLIVQDLPKVVHGISIQGIEHMSYDFFTPQPVKGARAYYFKAVMHDFNDEVAEKILGNTVAAMEKGYSTLLIEDFVLPEKGVGWRAAHLVRCIESVLFELMNNNVNRISP